MGIADMATGVWDWIFGTGGTNGGPVQQMLPATEANKEETAVVNDVGVKFNARGAAGTYIYSGYLNEEYLAQLRGKEAAFEYDKMRRMDGIITMCLMAVKNPIKSADWQIARLEESKEAEAQQKLIEHIMFKTLDKNWKKKLHEFLSMVDFGHAEVEKTHVLVEDDPEYGTYIGYKCLKLLSQKTIERFNIDKDGNLQTVTQIIIGDEGRFVNIEKQWLLMFSINQEGDNFEGVSMLRPCFGPFMRRKEAFKSEAIGNQSASRPTAIGHYPAGTQGGESKKNFDTAMEMYGNGQLNSLTVPAGFEVELVTNVFDSEKIRNGTINNDAREMVFSFLSNFLMLGANGYGTGALSFDLSDFYLSSLEHIADEICEVLNKGCIQELVKLNFANQKVLVEMKCTGIRDKIGLEFTQMLDYLVKNKVVQPDKLLEEDIRKRMKLPIIDEATTRETSTPSPFGGGGNTNGNTDTFKNKAFSESRKKSQASSLIEKKSSELAELFQKHLSEIGKNLVNSIMKQYAAAPTSREYNVTMNVDAKGRAAYVNTVYEAFYGITMEAYNQAMGEVGVKKIKFAEVANKTNNRLKSMADLAVDVQISRIEQAAKLQYHSSLGSTDSEQALRADMLEAVEKAVTGTLTEAGGSVSAAELVNKGRKDIFETPEVKDEIESFTFVNADPKTPCCIQLAGLTVSPEDPRFNQYQTPLHYNCKSYWVVNMKKYSDNPDLSGPIGLTKEAVASITLTDAK